MYFSDTGLAAPRVDTAAQRSYALYQEVQIAFEKRDCQRAAILLGAMMHVIADATFFYHVIEKAARASEYESHVDHVTFRTWNDGDRKMVAGATEFLNVSEARNKITTLTIDPYLATVYAGMDTYYGYSGYKDAHWLLSNAPISISRHYWAWVQGYWSSYEQQHTWTYSLRPKSGDAKYYFDTVSHNLNMAVYYCATALNYAISYGGYTDCECSGENPPLEPNPNPNPNPDGDKLTVPVKDATDEIMGLLFFNLVGLASTAIAIGQIKFWEKLLKLKLKLA